MGTIYFYHSPDDLDEGKCGCGKGDQCCQKTGKKEKCSENCSNTKSGILAKPPKPDS